MKKHSIAGLTLILGDITLFYAALFGWLSIRYSYAADGLALIKLHLIPFSSVFLVWAVSFGAFGLYDLKFMKINKQFFYRLLRALAINTVLAVLILYLIPFGIEPRRNLFLIALLTAIFIFLWRFLFNLLIIRTPTSRILFLGIAPEAVLLADYLLKNQQLRQRPVAFMSANGEEEKIPLPLPHFTSHQNLPQVINDLKIDTVVTLREIKENKTLINLLFQAIPLGVGIMEFSAFHEMITGKIPLSLIGEVWFLENLVGIKKGIYEFFKRGLDILVALLFSVPILILLPFIALAVKLDSGGPIFYRQKRVGRHGKDFWVIKYRSMVKDADKIGGIKGDGTDTRHTRVGRILRKSYLDELPQIINILKGEMSFVGPRPERPEYVSSLKQKIPFYEMRLLTSPGITGWAQVNMGNDASVEDAPEKMQYDLYYIKNRSFALDLLIILRTVFIILRRQGR